jgi:Nif-specific regulatory protein
MISVYLELLNEVCKDLSTTLDLDETLRRILFSFSQLLQLNRGTITLLNPKTETAYIIASVGLSRIEQSRGLYKMGEGITGRVIETGESVVIPLISKDSRFLDKTRSRSRNRKQLSFLCVPIRRGGKVVGALSTDRNYDPKHNLKQDLQILAITTNIIAHIMDMHNLREVERNRLMEENKNLKSKLQDRFQVSEIVTHSDKMREVLNFVSQVTESNTTVLIRGESGTGKELVAQAIHYNSLRGDMPFIKVNCSAMPESLIESELFGHERGAFTGARTAKPGKFELADKGTIFLDEIGELTPSTQVKLLRILQAREVERLGSTKTIKLDVRVITATNRNLEKDMAKGIFREDLYYRLNVFPIYLPPLRERKTDILLLAEHFLTKYNRENKKAITRITTQAINMLMSYHWPGNVRELENCIERAVLVCHGDSLRSNDLPPTLQMAVSDNRSDTPGLISTIDNLEQEMITDALKEHNGNQRIAAAQLRITERMMGYKIKKYGIVPRIYTSRKQIGPEVLPHNPADYAEVLV